MSEVKKFCRCGRNAYWYCDIHKIYYCRRCGCAGVECESDIVRRQHRHPLDHIKGAMKEIIPNLWLGDRFDVEQLGDLNPEWTIVAVLDYPENESPNEPVDALVYSIFGVNRDPVKYPYGSDWHEDPELQTDMQAMDRAVCEIRDALLEGRKVLVHCVGGIHRSPLVVAYFLFTQDYVSSIDEAYDLIISKRPEVQRRSYWLPKSFDPPVREDFDIE